MGTHAPETAAPAQALAPQSLDGRKRQPRSRRAFSDAGDGPGNAARLRRFARTRLRRFPASPEKSSAGLRPPDRKKPSEDNGGQEVGTKRPCRFLGLDESPRRRKASFRPLVSVFPPPLPA